MILIKKRITAQEQKIALHSYLDKDFSVTIVNNQRKVIFIKDLAQNYLVDEKHQNLVIAPSNEEQKVQIKNLLGDVWLDEAYHLNSTYKQRSYHIANNFISAPAKLTGEVAVCIDNRLTPTINQIQNRFEGQQQFFQLPLAENEIVSHLATTIEVNGQKLISTMKIISIEDAIMPKQYRDFLNYTISAKAA